MFDDFDKQQKEIDARIAIMAAQTDALQKSLIKLLKFICGMVITFSAVLIWITSCTSNY